MSDKKIVPEKITPETAEQIAEGLGHGFTKMFGRSAAMTVSEKDGRVTLDIEGRDSAQSVLSPEDVAALLQTTRDHVMERTRDTNNPLPHFAIGKVIRFKREDVLAWIDASVARGAIPKVAPPRKGKVKGRKR
jgi:excisionase family DNA binding protein